MSYAAPSHANIEAFLHAIAMQSERARTGRDLQQPRKSESFQDSTAID
jgi:hypothetical protein